MKNKGEIYLKKVLSIAMVCVLIVLTGCGVSKKDYDSAVSAKEAADKRVTDLEQQLKEVKDNSLTIDELYERFNSYIAKDLHLAEAYLIILNGDYPEINETEKANKRYDEVTIVNSSLPNGITLGEFSRLKVGMDYEQVKEIVGDGGEVLSELGDNQFYSFTGAVRGTRALISFANGTIETKKWMGF